MLVLLLGTVAATGYGLCNFLAGLASRRASTQVVAYGSQVISLVLLLVLVSVVPGEASFAALTWGFAAGVFTVGGILLFYRSLATGKMGLIAPINGAVTASVQILFGLLVGESITSLGAIGICCAVAAIVLAAPRSGDDSRTGATKVGTTKAGAKPLLLGALSGLFFAGGFICLSRTGSDAGLWPLLTQRVALLLILAPTALPLALRNTSTLRSQASLLGAMAALLVIADTCFVTLTRSDGLTIAAPLVSLAPVVVVVLARLHLHEYWSARQAGGLVLSISGALAIALS